MQAQPAAPPFPAKSVENLAFSRFLRYNKAETTGGPVHPALRAQRILWEAMRLVWAVACVRTAPRRRRELHAGSTRRASPHLCRALLARRVLWEAIHFIMRGDFFGQPRAEGANCMRVQPAARKRVQAQPANPAGQPAIMRRPVGGGGFYGKRCVL